MPRAAGRGSQLGWKHANMSIDRGDQALSEVERLGPRLTSYDPLRLGAGGSTFHHHCGSRDF
jgi:hypothetical protein